MTSLDWNLLCESWFIFLLSQIKEINNSMNIKKVAYRTYVYHTPPVRQTHPPFCLFSSSKSWRFRIWDIRKWCNIDGLLEEFQERAINCYFCIFILVTEVTRTNRTYLYLYFIRTIKIIDIRHKGWIMIALL